jgi:uncharacterized protein
MNAIDTTAAEARLATVLKRHGPLAIAVSGGVDSMTLAFLAHRLGDAEIVHAMSPAVPPEATARVHLHAGRHGWRLVTTRAREFEDASYLANPVNRCFFCKANLYDRIAELTDRRIASGANLDDLGDYRPGLKAAADRDVVHPLVEAGINKRTVRALAAAHGLDDLAELPAQPCLSSRIETGIPIDAGDLAFVHAVETAVGGAVGGAGAVRVRITGAGVELQLGETYGAEALAEAGSLARRLTAEAGRNWAGVRPYRRGSAFLHQR